MWVKENYIYDCKRPETWNDMSEIWDLGVTEITRGIERVRCPLSLREKGAKRIVFKCPEMKK